MSVYEYKVGINITSSDKVRETQAMPSPGQKMGD